MNHVRLPFVLLVLSGLSAGLRAQDDTAHLRVHSIRDFTAVHAPLPALPFDTFLGLSDQHEPSCITPRRVEPDCFLEEGYLLEYLSRLDSRLDEGELSVDFSPHHLMISGDPNETAGLVDKVTALRRELLVPIRIEAIVIRHDGNLQPPSRLDPAQARGLFESNTDAWTGECSTLSHMQCYVGNHRAISYAHDVGRTDAEDVALPKNDDLFDGFAMLATGHRTSNADELALQVQFAHGNMVAIEPHDPGLPRCENVQRPVVRTTAASMSGLIQNGGALVFQAKAPAAHGGNLAVVVRASWQKAPSALGQGLRAIPISALTMAGTSRETFAPSDNLIDDARLRDYDGDDETMPPLEEDNILEMIFNHVQPDTWEDTATAWMMAGVLFVQADEDVIDDVVDLVRVLERSYLRTTELTYTNRESRITAPSLVERGHAIRHGVETLATEVGNDDDAAVDRVRLFDGLELTVHPYVNGEGTGARLSWLTRKLQHAPVGHVVPTVDIARRDHVGPVPANGLQVGSGPLGREHVQLRVLQ